MIIKQLGSNPSVFHWTFASLVLHHGILANANINQDKGNTQQTAVPQEHTKSMILLRTSRRTILSQNAITLLRAFTASSLRSRATVAIVGSGPSGCYTAKYLRASLKHDPPLIHMLEKLPTPYGLVRSGVAPDHPEVKNVQNDFSQLFQGEHAVQLFANVKVGKDVSLKELRQMYDVVVLAYGCESDRKLRIKGENSLGGILSAREFVAWYNGHPDFVHVGEIVNLALNNNEKAQVVVIGQGNVALDCARIIAKGSSHLLTTDIASHALQILQERVQVTTVIGRRGHVQGACTIKEIRELTKLENASLVVQEAELQLGCNRASMIELETSKPKQRMDILLREVAATAPTHTKQVHLRFLLNPTEFVANETGTSLGAVVCERTVLTGDVGRQSALGTGEYQTIAADLALVSIGYKGVSVAGLEDFFDDTQGIVVNFHGKVDHSTEKHGGLYVSGWLKRGPSGIIGTNIPDAKDTVASIIEDLKNTVTQRIVDADPLESILKERGVQIVQWEAYQRIELAEADPRRKRHADQPREKIPDRDDLLKIAFSK